MESAWSAMSKVLTMQGIRKDVLHYLYFSLKQPRPFDSRISILGYGRGLGSTKNGFRQGGWVEKTRLLRSPELGKAASASSSDTLALSLFLSVS